MKGIVKFFDYNGGFGSIAPARGGMDTNVYMAALHVAGLETLLAGQHVRYDLAIGPGGFMRAINLELA